MRVTKDKERFPIRRRIRLPRVNYCEEHVFFITISTYERHPWFGLHPDLSKMCIKVLRNIAHGRNTQLFAWCIMPEHVHLLAQDTNIIQMVRLIKGRMTPYARQYEPKRRLWQRSFYDHALRKEESINRIAQYIFENPVRSGLVDNAVDHPWSGSNVWPNWSLNYELSCGRG